MVLQIFGVGKKNRARKKKYERALELWEEMGRKKSNINIKKMV